jgi:hypothetical protein
MLTSRVQMVWRGGRRMKVDIALRWCLGAAKGRMTVLCSLDHGDMKENLHG